MIMTPEEALEILNSDTLFKIQKDTSLSIRIAIETLIKDRENQVSKKKIENKKNKIYDEYISILSEYGNVDTDITFDIPNKNVRKHLDELVLEIMILQEILEEK